MMKRALFGTIGALGLTFCLTAPASADMTETSAERFAKKYFKDIVLDHIHGDDPTGYHMTDSEAIAFGPLQETYIPSSACYNTGETCTFVPTKEFVATVLQDGEPVNVIGTYEQSADTYAFSTFGSDEETPAALMDVKGKLISDAKESAWFDFDGDTLTALTSKSKEVIGGDAISVEDYQSFLIEERANPTGTVEEGMMGGSTSSEETNSESNTTRYFGFAFLAMLPFGYLVYRRRKTI